MYEVRQRWPQCLFLTFLTRPRQLYDAMLSRRGVIYGIAVTGAARGLGNNQSWKAATLSCCCCYCFCCCCCCSGDQSSRRSTISLYIPYSYLGTKTFTWNTIQMRVLSAEFMQRLLDYYIEHTDRKNFRERWREQLFDKMVGELRLQLKNYCSSCMVHRQPTQKNKTSATAKKYIYFHS